MLLIAQLGLAAAVSSPGLERALAAPAPAPSAPSAPKDADAPGDSALAQLRESAPDSSTGVISGFDVAKALGHMEAAGALDVEPKTDPPTLYIPEAPGAEPKTFWSFLGRMAAVGGRLGALAHTAGTRLWPFAGTAGKATPMAPASTSGRGSWAPSGPVFVSVTTTPARLAQPWFRPALSSLLSGDGYTVLLSIRDTGEKPSAAQAAVEELAKASDGKLVVAYAKAYGALAAILVPLAAPAVPDAGLVVVLGDDVLYKPGVVGLLASNAGGLSVSTMCDQSLLSSKGFAFQKAALAPVLKIPTPAQCEGVADAYAASVKQYLKLHTRTVLYGTDSAWCCSMDATGRYGQDEQGKVAWELASHRKATSADKGRQEAQCRLDFVVAVSDAGRPARGTWAEHLARIRDIFATTPGGVDSDLANDPELDDEVLGGHTGATGGSYIPDEAEIKLEQQKSEKRKTLEAATETHKAAAGETAMALDAAGKALDAAAVQDTSFDAEIKAVQDKDSAW